MPYEADLLLVNANVLTMDPGRPTASAVAVAGGRIVGIYDGEPDVTAKDVIDLRGLTLIPGFHDAHNHMIGFGLSLTEVDLRTGSQDELYARVAAKAATTPAGEWVIGSGYDQTRTGAHPDRDALDAIAPNHRIWLKHTSSHMCVVNSLVLADLGIGETVPQVDGGRVATDAAGRPTGLLEERAQELVGNLTHPYPLTTLTDAVHAAFPHRILNTHPALLPLFPGWHGVRDALAAGVSETGCTVHLATLEMDAGPILAQQSVPVLAGDTEETLHERIKVVERTLYPATVAWALAELEAGLPIEPKGIREEMTS